MLSLYLWGSLKAVRTVKTAQLPVTIYCENCPAESNTVSNILLKIYNENLPKLKVTACLKHFTKDLQWKLPKLIVTLSQTFY